MNRVPQEGATPVAGGGPAGLGPFGENVQSRTPSSRRRPEPRARSRAARRESRTAPPMKSAECPFITPLRARCSSRAGSCRAPARRRARGFRAAGRGLRERALERRPIDVGRPAPVEFVDRHAPLFAPRRVANFVRQRSLFGKKRSESTRAAGIVDVDHLPQGTGEVMKKSRFTGIADRRGLEGGRSRGSGCVGGIVDLRTVSMVRISWDTANETGYNEFWEGRLRLGSEASFDEMHFGNPTPASSMPAGWLGDGVRPAAPGCGTQRERSDCRSQRRQRRRAHRAGTGFLPIDRVRYHWRRHLHSGGRPRGGKRLGRESVGTGALAAGYITVTPINSDLTAMQSESSKFDALVSGLNH